MVSRSPTLEGVRAAKMSFERGMRVNMTLCFSQEQAAAVYAATKGAREPVYVSPFVGRLDDRGEDGMGVVANIKKMTEAAMVTCTCSRQAFVSLSTYCTVLAWASDWRLLLPKFSRSGRPPVVHCPTGTF